MIDTALLVFVSPISAWEISLKQLQGQLHLPLEPELWFKRAVEHHHLELCPLTAEIMMAAIGLPAHHRNPADCFIIASAVAEKAEVVTTDEILLHESEMGSNTAPFVPPVPQHFAPGVKRDAIRLTRIVLHAFQP